MTTEEPASPERSAHEGPHGDRAPVRDPSLSWIPLLGSAVLTMLLLSMVLIAYALK